MGVIRCQKKVANIVVTSIHKEDNAAHMIICGFSPDYDREESRKSLFYLGWTNRANRSMTKNICFLTFFLLSRKNCQDGDLNLRCMNLKESLNYFFHFIASFHRYLTVASENKNNVLVLSLPLLL